MQAFAPGSATAAQQGGALQQFSVSRQASLQPLDACTSFTGIWHAGLRQQLERPFDVLGRRSTRGSLSTALRCRSLIPHSGVS